MWNISGFCPLIVLQQARKDSVHTLCSVSILSLLAAAGKWSPYKKGKPHLCQKNQILKVGSKALLSQTCVCTYTCIYIYVHLYVHIHRHIPSVRTAQHTKHIKKKTDKKSKPLVHIFLCFLARQVASTISSSSTTSALGAWCWLDSWCSWWHYKHSADVYCVAGL